MSYIKKIMALSLIFCISVLGFYGCKKGENSDNGTTGNSSSNNNTNYKYEYNEEVAITPFWKMDVMYNEAVLFIQEGDELPSGKLLFDAKKIISVRDYSLNTEYVEGTDYTYKDGVITLTKDSKMPYMTRAQLNGEDLPESIVPMDSSRTDTGKVFFSETALLFKKQICVTYAYNKSDWKGPAPAAAKDVLPKTFEKLEGGKTLRLCVYGDSIAAGCNSSATFGLAPKLPAWAQLLKNGIEKKYKNNVFLTNPSVGGKMSAWGAENAATLVAATKPDLVVIAFGMNDGTGNIPGEDFTANIKTIISAVKEKNPDAEFILVAPMLANPDSDYEGCQRDYGIALFNMLEPGTALTDMGWVHEEMLKRKTYSSMSANNINHPSDFLVRVYAMEILSLLID